MRNYRIADPFGAMEARKKSNSLKKNAFSTFWSSNNFVFHFGKVKLLNDKMSKTHFGGGGEFDFVLAFDAL